MSSMPAGAGDPVAGVGPLDTVGEEATVGRGTTGLVGTGALMGGVHPSVSFLNTASFAAISARFCRMRSADGCLTEG